MAREVVSLSSAPPVGSKKGCLIIGLDKSTDKVQDTLLKTLEDHDGEKLDILIWVTDLGSVSGTVKSRCFQVWCPAECEEDRTPDCLEDADKFLSCLKQEYIAEGISILLITKASTEEFLKAIVFVLARKSPNIEKEDLELWLKIKPMFSLNRPTLLEVATVLFGWGENG